MNFLQIFGVMLILLVLVGLFYTVIMGIITPEGKVMDADHIARDAKEVQIVKDVLAQGQYTNPSARKLDVIESILRDQMKLMGLDEMTDAEYGNLAFEIFAGLRETEKS